MKKDITLDDGRKLTYSESFWTGKKMVYIDNMPLTKLSKTCFSDGNTQFYLNGSFLKGLKINGYTVYPKLSVLEIIFSCIPIFLLLGGAIGGALAAIAFFINVTLMRITNNLLLKFLCAISTTLIATALYFFLVILILG